MKTEDYAWLKSVETSIERDRLIRGAWLLPDPETREIHHEADAVLAFDEDGIIIDLISVERWREALPEHPVPNVTTPGAVWSPGFIDTHVHYPQTAIIGSASGPLLDWLSTSVFPEEARFADRDYAGYVAERFCNALLAQGTTTAAIFSSSHAGATEILFHELERHHLGAELGITLMDRGAPKAVLCPADRALADCERLIEQWHGRDSNRLRFCVTPRFGLSCTPELLRGAGRLADRHQLMVQTHISENLDELTATAEAFPEARDYLAVYEDLGLLHERSLFAHCIWLKDDEWSRLVKADAAVSHCPDSNFFLGSGAMPLSEVTSRGARMGLGSDVGAGRSFSIRKACARAYDASRITQSEVSPAELFWFATRGGALALRRPELGVIEPGAHADLVCLAPPPPFPRFDDRGQSHERSNPLDLYTVDELISALIFCEDWNAVREVRTLGEARLEISSS